MNRQEVLETATAYFKGNELQANVWVDKYCLQNREGEYIESTPDDMFHRLAWEFARIEKKYKNPIDEDTIYKLLKDFKYIIPGGSILYGLGNDYSFTSLGNCFVISDTTDSYGSICKIDEEQVQLMKRRGGVGHDLSHLRPAGAFVDNAAATSTGAVSFMHRYSNSTREVAQGGRRGALMLTMNVTHPDIEAFIESKKDTTKLTGCNISVKVTDDFMRSVKSGAEGATRVWGKLVHQAWATAEPGVLFWDTVTKNSPADKYPGFESVSTNPCGEIPLCPYDTCRLLSVNLFGHVVRPFEEDAYFDYQKFQETTRIAQRLMDDVVDLEEEKIDKILAKIYKDMPDFTTEYELWVKIKNKLLQGRRTGLSAIGLGDTLAALGLPYNYSGFSMDQIQDIFAYFKNSAYHSSEVMAEERGAFLAWDEKIDPIKRRNIALLTIPPSGSLAILAGITSGIEPVYQLEYTRRRKVDTSDNVAFVDKQGDKWEEYKVYHPKYEEYGKPEIYLGNTAHDIDPMERVKLQAGIQYYIDHSISSTINLPKEATEEQIAEIYMLAWESGCKGITVYRDGCRDGVLIDKKKPVVEFEQHSAPKRPKSLPAKLSYATVRGEKFCIILGMYDGKPYELFAFNVDKDNFSLNTTYKYSVVKVESGKYNLVSEDGGFTYGTVTEKLTEDQVAITRLISTSLRHGADIKFIVEQLNKTEGDLTSFTKAMARILKQYIADGVQLKGQTCDVCGTNMVMENGCVVCKACGYTKCS